MKTSPFICIHSTNQVQVDAESTYKAQLLALPLLQAKTRKKVKSYDITVMRADIIHVPTF